MDLTVIKVLDETPKGLTTGFRLKLTCSANGKQFVLDLPILVTKDVLTHNVPLPLIALEYLRKEGLSAWPDLFVDSRRFDLAKLGSQEPAYPLTLALGGIDALNQKALAQVK